MTNLILKSVSTLSMRTALLLLTALVIQPLYALDYPEEGDFAKGSKAWSENCARCHNMRSPSDLRDDQWITSVFHMRVRAGLTGEETRDIVAFLQSSTNEATESGQEDADGSGGQSGEEVYQANCAACHGNDGKGAFPGVSDLTGRSGPLAKPDSELFRNIKNGFQGDGSSIPMPPKGGNAQLTDRDINAVLRYMRTQFNPEARDGR